MDDEMFDAFDKFDGHTLQEWVDWAEHIDNFFDENDGSQWEIELIKVKEGGRR